MPTAPEERRHSNREANWEEAVAEVGPPRARIWRLYMAGSALGFEAGRLQVHQLLAVRPNNGPKRDAAHARPVALAARPELRITPSA
jgi:cyclopropane-fatty-acyl-phospholipid synthase